MKIALYSRSFPPAVGGVERFGEDLASWLAARGHKVTVLTVASADGHDDRDRPYRVLRRPFAGAVALAMKKADVTHLNGLAGRGAALALAVGRRPLVTHQGHQAVCPSGLAWSPHGTCSAGPRRGPCSDCLHRSVGASVRTTLHRGVIRSASINVCISSYLQSRLKPPRSTVIYNPVGEAAFVNHAPGIGTDGLVAFAGRLVWEKGLDTLLRALAMIPDARLEVAGDGPMMPAWVRLCRDLRIESRVRFLGSSSFEELAQLYARAAVVCVPSIWHEPFGYAAAEAMAMERCVVAPPSGALPELLREGRGFVAKANTVDALAAALKEALQQPKERLEVARRARRFAEEQLSMVNLGQRYEAAYLQSAT